MNATQERQNFTQGATGTNGEMARSTNASQQLASQNNQRGGAKVGDHPMQVCKFEELKGEFIVKREIGRGK